MKIKESLVRRLIREELKSIVESNFRAINDVASTIMNLPSVKEAGIIMTDQEMIQFAYETIKGTKGTVKIEDIGSGFNVEVGNRSGHTKVNFFSDLDKAERFLRNVFVQL